jgi:hypothetical protein
MRPANETEMNCDCVSECYKERESEEGEQGYLAAAVYEPIKELLETI